MASLSAAGGGAGDGGGAMRQRGQACEAGRVVAPNPPQAADDEDTKKFSAGGPPEKCDMPGHSHGHVGRGEKLGESCRRFLLSPHFKCLILCLVGVVPVFGMMLFLPQAFGRFGVHGLGQLPYYLVAVWLTVQFLYNFAAAQFTDPGGSLHIKPTFEATGQFEMVFGNDPGTPEAKQVGSTDPLIYAPNWCDHCKHWKPPRSHHCSFCRRCVLRMDHHCPFTGNCIGFRNHGHFILMYFFALLGLLYSLVLCVLAIYSSTPDMARKVGYNAFTKNRLLHGMTGFATSLVLQMFVRTSITIGLQTVFTVIALVAALSFGLPAIYMSCTGQTMLESHFPMKEYVQIKHQVYCPLGPGFYHRGILSNLRDLLGPRWWMRLLLPCRGGILEPHVAIAPRPSLAGALAVVGRVKQVEQEGVVQEVRSCEQLGINPGPEAAASGHVV